ncbi:MAG: NAD(P)/FAD-dependent oxidoreductase [Candidatus Omnitrophota bacterium]
MVNNKKNDYDVIIIGAGISGLVCGCYLAKAGLKTLIVEKNAQVGGYCTSFKRKGFHFDACVYFLSSFRKDGALGRLSHDFDLLKDINFHRVEVPDIVITPNAKVKFYHELDLTIKQLSEAFFNEHNKIVEFFHYIIHSPIASLFKLRSMSFKEILDSYFHNPELKTILSIKLLGYSGLPPSRLSALAACLIYREFVFDGGYYPEGGMQKFADILAERFIQNGGVIRYSKKVERVLLVQGKTTGVILDGKFLSAKKIIAACDIHQVYSDLIGDENLPTRITNLVKAGEPSLSAFLVYLGVDRNLAEFSDLKSHMWFISNHYDDIEKIYKNCLKWPIPPDYLALSSSSLKQGDVETNQKQTVFLFTNSPFIEKKMSDKERQNITSSMINLAEKVIPGIKAEVKIKVTATPLSLYKWTLNYKGACYGWASTVKQFGSPDFSEKTGIEGLYLTGHWSNTGGGVTSVINSGIITADRVLRDFSFEKEDLRP